MSKKHHHQHHHHHQESKTPPPTPGDQNTSSIMNTFQLKSEYNCTHKNAKLSLYFTLRFSFLSKYLSYIYNLLGLKYFLWGSFLHAGAFSQSCGLWNIWQIYKCICWHSQLLTTALVYWPSAPSKHKGFNFRCEQYHH